MGGTYSVRQREASSFPAHPEPSARGRMALHPSDSEAPAPNPGDLRGSHPKTNVIQIAVCWTISPRVLDPCFQTSPEIVSLRVGFPPLDGRFRG